MVSIGYSSSNVGTPTIDVVSEEPEQLQPQPRKKAKLVHKLSKPVKPTKSSKPSKSSNRTNMTASGTQTPVGDEWELDCEVCGRRGMNLVCMLF